MNKPTLLLLVGPPGVGKTTYAIKEFVSQGNIVYINQDGQGKKGHFELFEKALGDEKDILIDRMNFSFEQRHKYLTLAKARGYHTKIIILHESYKTCLDRCIARQGHETIKTEEDAKSALRTFFTKYERVKDNEADQVVRIWWQDREKPNAAWFDIDGTTSDPSHRQPLLSTDKSKRDWKLFFSTMDQDPCNEWCKTIIQSVYNRGICVLMCSARPEDYREVTEKWLDKHKIPRDELIMRWSKDYRDDSIVKEIMYEFEVKTRYNLLFAIDDRKKVIDQIRTHGVIVLDCAGEKGNF